MTIKKREPTEVRRQQIVDAALLVIGKKGITRATTSEIAAAAGISEGNLYRHFRNKEAIVQRVIEKIGDDLSSILSAVAGIPDPIAKLEAIFKRHFAYMKGHGGIPRTIFSEEVMVLREELRKGVRNNVMVYYEGVREVFAIARKQGATKPQLDPKALTCMFMGTINFSIIRWTLSDFSIDLKNEAEMLWQTFVQAIVVPEP